MIDGCGGHVTGFVQCDWLVWWSCDRVLCDVIGWCDGHVTGFSNGQGYLHEGVRYSTTIAYREPALARRNLDFATNSIVRKVRLSKKVVRLGMSLK